MSGLTPRPYQRDAVAAVFRELSAADSTLVELPTGCGKTVVFGTVAAGWPSGRVMAIAHRNELVTQAKESMEFIAGEEVGVEMGASRADRRLNVSTVQTLSARTGFDPAGYGLLVVDEAHHATALTYRAVIERFRRAGAKVLLVTATPKRADGTALGVVAESVAYRLGIREAMAGGWLVPVRCRATNVIDVDWRKVATKKNAMGETDFVERDLDALIAREGPCHEAARPLIEIAGGRPTLVFCVSVDHAKLMAAVLNHYDGGADWLDGSPASWARRADTVAAFKAGKVKYLCNCALFLEGFDAPGTRVVAMLRPTQSLSLYTQVLGRVTRPLKGVIDGPHAPADDAGRHAAIAASAKPFGTVVDFVGNSSKHSIVTATDVLGGHYDAAVRAKARRIVEAAPGGADASQALERAARQVAAEKAAEGRPPNRIDPEIFRLVYEREQQQLRDGVRAEVRWSDREVDVFGDGRPDAPQAAPKQRRGGAPPSDKQVDYLCRLSGYSREAVYRMPGWRVSELINEFKAKRAA